MNRNSLCILVDKCKGKEKYVCEREKIRGREERDRQQMKKMQRK